MLSNRDRTLATAALAAWLAGCVDGMDPKSLDLVESVAVQAAVVFSSAPTASELGSLSRARVTALHAVTDAPVGTAVHDLDPAADEWVLEVTIDIVTGESIPVRLQVELISVDDQGLELVQWSGETPPIEVRTDTELREIRLVSLFRGPLDNLSVTKISLTAPDGVPFGRPATLTSAIEGGGPGALAFYRSLDPDIADVHPLGGLVETADTGTARLVAEAGPVADTVSFFVVSPPEPEDAEEVGVAAGSVEDTGERIVQGMEDAEAAANITLTLESLSAVLVSGDVMAAIRAFRAAVEALAAYGADSAELRYQDGPQLSLIHLSLIHVADALGVPFG